MAVKNSYKNQALKINKDNNAPFEFIEIPKSRKDKVLVKCKNCGNIFETKPQHIIEWKKRNRKGCSKCQSERAIKGYKEKGGLTQHPAYIILDGIKQRCYNKNCRIYKYYGAKGVKVCNEWMNKKNGYLNFCKWADENGYKKGLTIDRIDPYGDYEPSNCRWVPIKQQRENRRIFKTNTSGFIGVSFNKQLNKYESYYEINGKKCGFGYFKWIEQAYLTRVYYMLKNKIKLPNYIPEYEYEILKWGNERLLYKFDKKVEINMLEEELKEYNEAKNIYEKIDALCDYYVIFTQTLAKAGLERINLAKDNDFIEYYKKYKKIQNEIEQLGFNFECTMKETLKEINSRTGAFDEKKGKWVKDKSPEAKAKWIKADYKNCKINSSKRYKND